MLVSVEAEVVAAIAAGEGVVASPVGVEGCVAVNPAGRSAIGAWSRCVPIRWPVFLWVMKDLLPVISSYLTTGVPDIIFVVSILVASAADGCVIAAAIGVSHFFIISMLVVSTVVWRVVMVAICVSDLFSVRGLVVVRWGRRARVSLLPLRAKG